MIALDRLDAKLERMFDEDEGWRKQGRGKEAKSLFAFLSKCIDRWRLSKDDWPGDFATDYERYNLLWSAKNYFFRRRMMRRRDDFTSRRISLGIIMGPSPSGNSFRW